MIDIKKFKAARAAADMSQGEVGKRAGVSQQLIGEIERGATRSTKAIYRIAKALDVKAYELDPEIPAPLDAWEEAVYNARELDDETQRTILRNLQDYIDVASRRAARLKDL
jgi:transcriptional regulator with XRE-family HTH domain